MQYMKPVVVFVVAALAPAVLLAQPFGVRAPPERPRQERPRPTIPETVPPAVDAAPETPESPDSWARLDNRAKRLVDYSPCTPGTLQALNDAKWAYTAEVEAVLATLGDWRDVVASDESTWDLLAYEAQERLERYKGSLETSGGGHVPALPDDPAFAEASRIYEEVQAERRFRQQLVGQTIDFVIESLEIADATKAVYRAAIRRVDAIIDSLHAEADLQDQFYTLIAYQVRVSCRPRLEPPSRSPGLRIWNRRWSR